MIRPEDIPERVWEEAMRVEQNLPASRRGYIGDIPNLAAVAPIARTILAAEKRVREECVTDAREAWLDGIPAAEIWLDIRARGVARAAAIRKGGADA